MTRSHTPRPSLSYPEARTLAGQERAIALRALMLQLRDWLKTIRARWPALVMVEPVASSHNPRPRGMIRSS